MLPAVRFLDLIKPFTPILPEVASPESKIPFNQKLMWTGVSIADLFADCGLARESGPRLTIRASTVDAHDIFGNEPDAVIWNRVIGHVRSTVLAADDAGK